MSALHVVPLNDAIGHDTATGEAACVCGPQIRPVDDPQGAVDWLIVHASLDGRETRERTQP